MEPQHVPSTLAALPELQVSAATTPMEAAAAMRVLAGFDRCIVGTIRFSGQTPWERHPGDELLYVVQGAVDATVMLDDGPHVTSVDEGSVFVVPAGRWPGWQPDRALCRPVRRLEARSRNRRFLQAADPVAAAGRRRPPGDAARWLQSSC